jgi:hypothetical protein
MAGPHPPFWCHSMPRAFPARPGPFLAVSAGPFTLHFGHLGVGGA